MNETGAEGRLPSGDRRRVGARLPPAGAGTSDVRTGAWARWYPAGVATRATLAGAAILCLGLAMLTHEAHAARRTIAVPFYSAEQFAHALHESYTLPRAKAFETAAQAMQVRVDTWCAATPPATAERDAARASWQDTMVAWTTLSGVMVGPLVARKSARNIDFSPVRANLIERAVAAQPKGAAAMELVGGPAKGLGALEWLLWTKPATPGTPACAYAIEVAADIGREAGALAAAFAELAAREWEEDAAVAAMDEAFNQWLGAIDRLRWAQMDKPLRAAGGNAPEYPRSASKSTPTHWRAHWSAVETLGYDHDKAPGTGEPGVIPWAAYLRGRGLNPAADALGTTIESAGKRVQAADPARPATVSAAASSLAAVKRLAEAKVAPGLKISVGFSDADGD